MSRLRKYNVGEDQPFGDAQQVYACVLSSKGARSKQLLHELLRHCPAAVTSSVLRLAVQIGAWTAVSAPSGWQRLPNELLARVFEFTREPDRLTVIERVCRRWRHASLEGAGHFACVACVLTLRAGWQCKSIGMVAIVKDHERLQRLTAVGRLSDAQTVEWLRSMASSLTPGLAASEVYYQLAFRLENGVGSGMPKVCNVNEAAQFYLKAAELKHTPSQNAIRRLLYDYRAPASITNDEIRQSFANMLASGLSWLRQDVNRGFRWRLPPDSKRSTTTTTVFTAPTSQKTAATSDPASVLVSLASREQLVSCLLYATRAHRKRLLSELLPYVPPSAVSSLLQLAIEIGAWSKPLSEPSRWQLLPHAPLSCVFAMLSDHEKLTLAERVCRQWRDASLDGAGWRDWPGRCEKPYDMHRLLASGRITNAHALAWLRKYSTSDPEVIYWRARLEEVGVCGDRDIAMAVTIYTNSVNHWKHTPSQDALRRLIYAEPSPVCDVRQQMAFGALLQEGKPWLPKDGPKAIEWYTRAAEQGDSKAQYELGRLIDDGELVPRDSARACYWYRKAAEQGHIYAANNLGVCVEGGIGTAQNLVEAVKWYTKAAEGGRPIAMSNLAGCYARGVGVEKDMKMAVQWYQRADHTGHAHSAYELGRLYENGKGVARDSVIAYRYYSSAAARGDKLGQFAAAWCLEHGKGCDRDAKQAATLYRLAAEKGHAMSAYFLANFLKTGTGVAKDAVQAVFWYRMAADTGDAFAQWHLSQCYEEGVGVDKDRQAAFEWLLKAAKGGEIQAQLKVAEHYRTGNCVAPDEKEAEMWYRKVADNPEPEALNSFGGCLMHGKFVPVDEKAAFDCLSRAAAKNYCLGQFNVAWCYLHGIGVHKDERAAAEYFQRAASNDDDHAQYMLGVFQWDGLGGMEQDRKAAMDRYRLAAVNCSRAAKAAVDRGHAAGLCALAEVLEQGINFWKDERTALVWYQRAVDAGSVEAVQRLKDLNERLAAAQPKATDVATASASPDKR